jgi:UDP-GlcNAc:undecaprenyl-phosphate GlcNAc-1-phosphate transferase
VHVSAYFAVFAAAAGVTFLATPLVRRFVLRAGAIYYPGDRTVHTAPLPTMGGLAMYLGLLAGLGASRLAPFFADVNAASPEPVAALIACSLIVGLGVVDDTRGVTWLTKLTAQVFIAGVLVLTGVKFDYFWIPTLGIVGLSGDLGAILAIVWVVAVINAVNLVDGLDGLAAGMVGIAAATFFAYMAGAPSLFGDASQAALLAAITVGLCAGFLPWNFHPAKIFMGDTGSMLLGLLLAIATISGIGRNPLPPSGGDVAATAGTVIVPLLVPLLVLAVPFLDVVLAVARRTRRGQGIGHADKEHLHHRLMDIGHGHRQAVLLMYLWSALLSLSGLAVGLIDGRVAVGLILVGAVTLFLVTALPRLTQRRAGGTGGPQGSPDRAAAPPGSVPEQDDTARGTAPPT